MYFNNTAINADKIKIDDWILDIRVNILKSVGKFFYMFYFPIFAFFMI